MLALTAAGQIRAQLSPVSVSTTASIQVPFTQNPQDYDFSSVSSFGTNTATLSSGQLSSPPIGQIFSGSSTAIATQTGAGGQFDPGLSASTQITVTQNEGGNVKLIGYTNTTLQYQFEIAGPSSSAVPVTLSALLSLGGQDNGYADNDFYTNASLLFYGSDWNSSDSWSGSGDPGSPTEWYDPAGDNSFAGSIDTTFDLETGVIYTIDLNAGAHIAELPSDAAIGLYEVTASVDPMLTVPIGYSIDYSPGFTLAPSAAPDAASTWALAAISAASLLLLESLSIRPRRRRS